MGFTAATVLTAAGLVLLAGSVAVDARSKAVLMAGAVAYAIAGTLWYRNEHRLQREQDEEQDAKARDPARHPPQQREDEHDQREPAEHVPGASIGAIRTPVADQPSP